MDRLVISPHLDDEVLGCASVLGSDTFVLYCGRDEESIQDAWVRSRPTEEERLAELDKVEHHFGFDYYILSHPVNNYELRPLVSSFEACINKHKPRQVFIPHPSYNQDHKTVYEAALIALRPHDINWFVPQVLVYEQPHVYLWGHSGHDFKPNYFIPLDVEDKIEAYNLYKTQVRDFRGPDQIRAIARMRGAQANVPSAEGFQILRWVD